MSATTPHARFASLGLTLPPAPRPIGAYTPALVVGPHLYLSGHLPVLPDGSLMRGRVGRDHDADAGQLAARQVGLTMLATVIDRLGSLDRIHRVIKVLGMVNSTPEFDKHPHVINGCSELFGSIWGPELGVGVRSAFGVAALPNDVAVEIEALFEIA